MFTTTKPQLRSLLFATTAITALGFAGPALAGDIEGMVRDSSGVSTLAGAEIELVELERSAESARDGTFRFTNVPAGTYTLRVRYSSAQGYTEQVTVPATGATEVDVALASVNPEETILIIGQRASLASSISRERSSDTVQSVVTRDSIGQFPDQNVAEAVRRVTGTNVLNDQGEGRFIAIRGLDPNLNSSSINGVRVMAPESDVRAVALDVIPSELVESIEVQKALTPDMDADGIGGSVNINTTRGFDRIDPLLSIRGEGSYNDLNGEWSPRFSVDFARAFGDLGIAGGFSYNNRNFSTDNIEMDGWDEDGGIVYADEIQFRDYDVERTRTGGSLSLDYRLDDMTVLYARGLYSEFEDQEFRHRLTFAFDEAPSSGTANSATFLSDDGEIEVERDIKDRYEVQHIMSVLLGGETDWNQWHFRYEGSWSFSDEEENGSLDPIQFQAKWDDPGDLGVTISTRDWQNPSYTIDFGESTFLDPAEYEFNDVERTSLSLSEDEEFAFRLDATRYFALERGTFEAQFGIRGRFRDKTYDKEVDFYENDMLTLDMFLGSQSYGLANIEPTPDSGSFARYFRQNFGDFEWQEIDSEFDSLVEDYEVEEDILAAYVMGRYDRGPLRIVGGLRVEQTDRSANGNLVELFEGGGIYPDDTIVVTPVSYDDDYTDLFPSLNLRYELTDDVILRGAAYRSIVRPSPGQSAPRFIVEEDDGGDREGEFGNPDLEPYYAWNFDASVAWYFGGDSVLQGGIFYKDIDTFIVDFEADGGAGDPFGGVFNGVAYDEAVIPINGEEATVFGIEIGYAQPLDFLPGLFDGLVIGANYTYTDAEGEVFGRSIPLPASSENTYNLMFGYDRGPIDARFSVSYRDMYLDELGDNAGEDRLVDEHIQYDLTIKYDVTDNVQLYTEFVNLGDEPYVAYQTGPDNANHLLQYEEYSWTAKVGVRVQF